MHDYGAVTADQVTRLVSTAIADAEGVIAGVTAASEHTFESTLAPLDTAATIIADAYGAGAFMARVHPEPDVRARAAQAEENITKWAADLVFRRDLYDAVARFAESDEATELQGTKRRLLDEWVRDFRRAGHHLADDARKELRNLKQRLVEIEVAFGTNLDEWSDHLDVAEADLEGLPDSYVEGLSAGDAPSTKRVTMANPDYFPFMEQARRRDLRRRLQHKHWNRAAAENKPLLEEAVRIRRQMARLLGHPTWAYYAMEVKMAKHPDAVEKLYGDIVPGLTSKAVEERAAMQALLEADEPGVELCAWDWRFYHNERKRREYGVDANEVAAYFRLESVVDGMFDVTGEVFGLTYRRIEDARAWHPDVALYEIIDKAEGNVIAWFYADLFPRDGKYSHAAAFPITYGKLEADGSYRKPVAAIVANFTSPTGDRPSLLKHNEAVTLFHEFGHILHFCLTKVDLVRFSGYDAEWDFVEAPSQIMEHWMWQPSVLARFAKHFETGEPIPVDLVERLVAARDLNKRFMTMRQVFLGRLDLLLHGDREDLSTDGAYREAYELTLLPFHEGTFFPAGFGHLMGGYDAGYYGYLWAEVYGDDMFSVFQDEGIMSPAVGARYRKEVLETGGSRDAIEHLRAFLGREPSAEAFLAKLGITSGHGQ